MGDDFIPEGLGRRRRRPPPPTSGGSEHDSPPPQNHPPARTPDRHPAPKRLDIDPGDPPRPTPKPQNPPKTHERRTLITVGPVSRKQAERLIPGAFDAYDCVACAGLTSSPVQCRDSADALARAIKRATEAGGQIYLLAFSNGGSAVHRLDRDAIMWLSGVVLADATYSGTPNPRDAVPSWRTFFATITEFRGNPRVCITTSTFPNGLNSNAQAVALALADAYVVPGVVIETYDQRIKHVDHVLQIGGRSLKKVMV